MSLYVDTHLQLTKRFDTIQ